MRKRNKENGLFSQCLLLIKVLLTLSKKEGKAAKYRIAKLGILSMEKKRQQKEHKNISATEVLSMTSSNPESLN